MNNSFRIVAVFNPGNVEIWENVFCLLRFKTFTLIRILYPQFYLALMPKKVYADVVNTLINVV